MHIESRWGRWVVGIAAAALLGGTPVQAGPSKGKSTSKEDGGINPSNIAVVDDDMLIVSADASYFADADLCEEPASRDDYDAMCFQLGTPEAHAVATGKGVVVAVLDGGFNVHHPSIAGSLLWGYDAIDQDGDPHDMGNGIDDDRDGCTDNAVGHGTFVAGMVLKAAPDALILPVRVRDDEGFGSNRELIRGIDFAVDMGADVINLSLSRGQTKVNGLWSTMYKAMAAGVVFVVSVGNDGLGEIPDLATVDGMLVAGAVDCSDRIASFSNYADYATFSTMVFAPGVNLYGPMGTYEMGEWSGTSFAAGLISGAAALVREIHPDSSYRQVSDIVGDSLDPVTFADGTPYGYGGRINLAKVVTK